MGLGSQAEKTGGSLRAFLKLLLVMGLAGCTGSDRVLHFNLGIETVQLDWNRAIDSASVVVLDNVMEGLTTYADSFAGNQPTLVRPMPALAASWSVTEGGKVYRFHLKQGVHWSDGAELEAGQFLDSWRRLLSPQSRSANAYHHFDIEGAAAYNAGSERDFSKVGVKAIDKYTLEVRLRRQTPYFLHLVASASTFPLRQDLLDKFGEQWAAPENLVTLGPYRVAAWAQGDHILLQAFPGYHGMRPQISSVKCRLISEPLAAYALYENEELDILPRDLPASFVKQLQGSPEYRTGPKLQVSYLLFNTKRAPFNIVANRRAFIRALNRQQLSYFFQGAQAPTSGWIPPGLLGYSSSVGAPAEGKDFQSFPRREIELHYSGNDTWNLAFQEMKRQAEAHLGIRVKLRQFDPSTFGEFLNLITTQKLAKGDHMPEILHLGWVADYPDSHSFMNVFTSASESNYGRWSNALYDRLVESAVSTQEEPIRAQLYLQAQRILLEEEAVVMPLFFTSHRALVRSSLKGVQLNVLDKWYFRNLSFEGDGWRGFGRSFLRHLRGGGTGA